MDLTNLDNLKNLLGKFGIRLSKKLGQNFLIDRRVLEKILLAAELNSLDKILEIGAGIGTLTRALARRGGKVVAIEKDKRFIPPLKLTTKDFSNVEIINGDFLRLNLADIVVYKLQTKNYKVVANIPYYITGEILRRLLEPETRPKMIVLLVQKEVAERIAARPPQMSMLALSVQFYGKPVVVDYVSASSFYPPPEVDSAILKIITHQTARLRVDEKSFFRLARVGFSAKRKTLLNNLAAGFCLDKSQISARLKACGLRPRVRAQELSLEDWERLGSKFEWS